MNAIVKNEPQAVTESAAIIQVIERAARDPNVDVEKMERLLLMKERVEAKQAEAEFNAAMTDAQTDIRPIAADAMNASTRNSKYASYLALDKVLRPIYTKHGFALSFDTATSTSEGHIKVLCYVSHTAGHSRTYQVDMPADGKGAKGGDVMTKTHATGAAMTYGQRYLLKMIFNIAIGDDDDGNSAGGDRVLNAEELKTVRGLIDKMGVDIEKFCKAYGIEALPDLKASKYKEAVERINLKGVRHASG